MAASVLNTKHAVEMSLYVVRAFVQLREALAAHKVKASLRCHSSTDGAAARAEETPDRIRLSKER